MRQLTCVISNEDMDDDKSPKTSTIDYSAETSTWDDNSIVGKTTNSWTSNTINAEYSMPTRHRRETEDTLSPVSTKSSFKEVKPIITFDKLVFTRLVNYSGLNWSLMERHPRRQDGTDHSTRDICGWACNTRPCHWLWRLQHLWVYGKRVYFRTYEEQRGRGTYKG